MEDNNKVKWEEKDEEDVQKVMRKIPTLEQVYDVYKKWLHIEDTKRLDIGFAISLTRKMRGTPIWLIIVGPSGDMKSEQIRALHNDKHTEIVQRFTSKTLISGDRKVGLGNDYCCKFAAKNEKLLLIFDMAQMLKLPTIEKAEVWAQLRDLYDGSLTRFFGNRVRKSYDNLRVTLIAGSTPHIDSQILIHQDLGTRELLYRTTEVKEWKDIMSMVLKNEQMEEQMKKELKEITNKFLKYKTVKELILTDKQIEKLEELVKYLSFMRAVADTDSYSGEVRADVSSEMPTRIVKQLKRIFVALMSLEKGYPEERAFEILRYIVLSSCNQNRVKIYHHLRDQAAGDGNRKSTSQIATTLHLGKRTTYRELGILANMGLIKHETTENDYGRVFDYWHYSVNCEKITDFPPINVKYRKRNLNKLEIKDN